MMGSTYQEGSGDAESDLHGDALLLLLLLLADRPESWICEPILFRTQLVGTTKTRIRLQYQPRIDLFVEMPNSQGDMMTPGQLERFVQKMFDKTPIHNPPRRSTQRLFCV
jgi:hypothetical protein